MSNIANIADYRAPGFAPANDFAPSADTSPATTRSQIGPAMRAGLFGVAFAAVKTIQVLAFITLRVLRGPLRIILALVTGAMLLGLPMFWFGYDEGTRERTLFLSVAIGSIFGCGLFGLFYDELLARLDPRQPPRDA
jgi:hypothetical protein